jgi:hypothetical protein
LESFGRKFPNLANLLNLFLYYTKFSSCFFSTMEETNYSIPL